MPKSLRSSHDSASLEGLRPIVKQSFQKQLFQNCGAKWKEDMVLIVDDSSMRIISKSMGMYDLMENRVYLVEQLHLKRAPYRQSAPIYFLSPTLKNVNALIADWTPDKTKRKQEPLYADSVFLFFTKAVPDELFGKIKACKPLIRRLAAFSEINIDFIANENRAFHFDMASSNIFSKLYKHNVNGIISPEIEVIADKLVTVCATLNEYPHIRYRASSNIATSIAHLFNSKFNAFVGSNKTWWYHGDGDHSDRGRSTLMILSRQDDCLSPLLHEFTYQAMVNDLLDLEDEKITVEVPSENGTEKKDVLLNDNDELWVELRGQHIADVIKILSKKIHDIVESKSGVGNLKKKEGKPVSIAQMTNVLKNLPEYREVMSKLSQHMHIAHKCMGIFNSTGLLDISDLEQTMANGTDDNGKSVKVSSMVSSVEAMLKNVGHPLMRFRLLAIFIISQKGLRASDKDRLLAAANLNTSGMKTLLNLEALGYPLTQDSVSKKLLKRSVDAASEFEYITSRYACDLKGILSQNQTNSLSFNEYPSIYPMPDEGNNVSMASSGVSSVRQSTSRYSSKKSKSISGSKTRMIVFVAGGACYSELRAANEIMEKGGQEIIMGSTHYINPTEFTQDLSNL